MRGGIYSLIGKTLVVCDDPHLRDLVTSELRGFGVDDYECADQMPKKMEPSVANVILLSQTPEGPFGGTALGEWASDEHFKLKAIEHEGRRYWMILSPSARGCYYGFMKFLEGKDEFEDGPGFEIRGIVEGFYGPPWSWEDRMDMVRFMSDLRMNLYVYAPKDDSLHRKEWREKYDEETMERFSSLVNLASSRFVSFCFALSPGLDIEYASEEDVEAVLTKLLALHAIGVKDFALFLDDIPDQLLSEEDKGRFGSLGEAQRHFLERVLERLRETDPETRLFFCPTKYHGTEADSYHDEISKLPKDVAVFWTGPRICSPEITASDAEGMKQAFKRKVLVWDNYPVNDYAPSRLHMNAVRNRGPDLNTSCIGMVSNPMSKAEASKVAVFTYGEYLWGPKSYDPDVSLDRALTFVFGPGALSLARVLVENLEDLFYPDSPLGHLPELEEADDIEMERLAAIFGEMERVSEIPGLVDNDRLIQGIKDHVRKVSDLGRLGKVMLEEEMLRRRILRNKSMVRSFGS